MATLMRFAESWLAVISCQHQINQQPIGANNKLDLLQDEDIYESSSSGVASIYFESSVHKCSPGVSRPIDVTELAHVLEDYQCHNLRMLDKSKLRNLLLFVDCNRKICKLAFKLFHVGASNSY